MKISILTLFPEMFVGPLNHSILKRSQEKKLVTIEYIQIRNFGMGKHKVVDDTPYGGGAGMIMRADVLGKAIESARCKTKCKESVILLDAQGKTFDQKEAGKLTKNMHLILVCGHYEGVDERVKTMADKVLSIGDYVLTGGEIPAMVIVDSVVRLIPGVIKKQSKTDESFSTPMLEYPQYTKPRRWKGLPVPQVLLSGNHEEIKKWRKKEAVRKTRKQRPDLLRLERLKSQRNFPA